MKRLVVSLVRKLAAFAFSEEIATHEGVAKIMELHATEGAMELHIEQNPALAHYVVSCFANIVGDAPNFVEMQAHLGDAKREFVITIRRKEGKTPTELKEEVERKLYSARCTVLLHCQDLRKAAVRIESLEQGRCFLNTCTEFRKAADELEEALK